MSRLTSAPEISTSSSSLSSFLRECNNVDLLPDLWNFGFFSMLCMRSLDRSRFSFQNGFGVRPDGIFCKEDRMDVWISFLDMRIPNLGPKLMFTLAKLSQRERKKVCVCIPCFPPELPMRAMIVCFSSNETTLALVVILDSVALSFRMCNLAVSLPKRNANTTSNTQTCVGTDPSDTESHPSFTKYVVTAKRAVITNSVESRNRNSHAGPRVMVGVWEGWDSADFIAGLLSFEGA
mmetsp:Transcript_1485/g.3208  ORF Transcript_1485/g.3208 Transcript_1485/m.3208 type:complete len:235 (+) Transcript_1485:807-1511(+)